MIKKAFQDNRLQKQILIHISIWSLFIVFNLMQPQFETDFITKEVVFLLIGNIAVFYINYSYLVTKFLLKNKMGLYVGITVVLILMSSIAFKEFGPEFVPKPADFPPMPNIRPAPIFHFKLIGPIAFNILLVVTGTALRVYTEWNRNERKKKEIEVQKSSTELHFLKHQLSPHFLFNSLNSIYSLTTKKSNEAPEAVITLSELMRYMLYETNNEFVPLKSELHYIQNYLKLQRIRIANNEKVTLNIHGMILNQKIRPLLLISFIENAFKYGTDFKGNTEVKIEISISGNELQFNCMNIIGNRKTVKDSSGIGLQNTQERLELLYPEKHVLMIEERHERFIVNLKLELD